MDSDIRTQRKGPFLPRKRGWVITNYEYFILNIYTGGMIAREIPGIRPQPGIETQYIMRYAADDYRSIMNKFLEYIPPGLPEDLADYCNMPGCRLTTPNGAKFYPIYYHNDLAGWRKQISESAKLHGTLTAHFKNGKFLLSDGQKINFSDLIVAGLTGQEPYPSDW